MARCGCSSSCLCSLAGTDCVTVTGAGTADNPYTITIVIDPAEDNLIECTEDGLRVSATTTIEVGSTDCIELTGLGTEEDPVVASPRLDVDDTNLLTCGPDGLFANPVGAAIWNPRTVAADTAAVAGDFIRVNASGGDVTVTLPDATLVPGRMVSVKRSSSTGGDVIVEGDGGQTIDGNGDYTLAAIRDAIQVVSGGTDWHIMGVFS